jgi:hypothetical protein
MALEQLQPVELFRGIFILIPSNLQQSDTNQKVSEMKKEPIIGLKY